VVPVSLQALPDGDVAILHVNLSVVPAYYAELAGHYPKVLNGRVLDIRKRIVSRNILRPGDGWEGPVIVKSDLNSNGTPERVAAARAERLGKVTGRSPPEPISYEILPDAAAVPEAMWRDQNLVVERFLPEQEGERYHLRTWLFFGDRERCVRCYGPDPIVKGARIEGFDESEVPEAIRAERERLGFNFGKFDFAVHGGTPILFDANKTPSLPPASANREALYEHLADGLDGFLADRVQA
jgi:hypothetical protein